MKFENISASYDVGIAKKYGIQCAVLLNKLLYLSKYTSREDGYCWRTAKELEDELGLTRNQQELAIKKLEDAGIIETKNTYIIGTQIKCKHFKIIVKSEIQESNKSDLLESRKSEMLESNKSVNNNKTIIENNNNIKIKINKKEELYELVESNFGRTLSPLEYEEISQWEDNEITRYAIKEAVLRRALSVKYINAIIRDCEAKGIKTIKSIRKAETNEIEPFLFEYDWLEDDDEKI